jgi:hypothetical protein
MKDSNTAVKTYGTMSQAQLRNKLAGVIINTPGSTPALQHEPVWVCTDDGDNFLVKDVTLGEFNQIIIHVVDQNAHEAKEIKVNV